MTELQQLLSMLAKTNIDFTKETKRDGFDESGPMKTIVKFKDVRFEFDDKGNFKSGY